MKIIDAIVFNNELEILFYRLTLMYMSVDFFIIVESKQTILGQDKRLFYKENEHLFEKFKDKIIHIIVSI
jgi:beta-1,4-mannosyl-glycoprotein beta-1,4-N-acetylglucosaminyltransferase